MTTFDPSVWTSERVETGAVQFGSDWPGVFLRGDFALPCAMELGRMMSKSGHSPMLASLASVLASCDARNEPNVRAIPSAEEIAALVGLERAVLDAVTGAPTSQPERYEGDNHGDSFSSGWDSGEFSMAKKLRAALARLDAARKERGA